MSSEKHQSESPEPTLFGLFRHGLTIWNEEKRIQGRLDSPLSEKGKEIILDFLPTLKKYRWTRIVASDLGRVQQTVSIINRSLNLPVFYDARLREIDWGNWEGQRLADIKVNQAEELNKQTLAGWDFQAPGGESRREVLKRTQVALNQAAEHWPGENILIVCHLGVIKCVLYHILQKEFMPDDKKTLTPNGLHIISLTEDGWSCKQLNIQAHQ